MTSYRKSMMESLAVVRQQAKNVALDESVIDTIKAISGLPYGANGSNGYQVSPTSKPLFETYLMPVTVRGLFDTY